MSMSSKSVLLGVILIAMLGQFMSCDSTAVFDQNVKIADEIEALQEENILLIKIDVEGHEINALKGAEKIIKSNKPVILFEQGAEVLGL